jgi:hypothetical protein
MNSRGGPPILRGGPPLGTISMDQTVYDIKSLQGFLSFELQKFGIFWNLHQPKRVPISNKCWKSESWAPPENLWVDEK